MLGSVRKRKLSQIYNNRMLLYWRNEQAHRPGRFIVMSNTLPSSVQKYFWGDNLEELSWSKHKNYISNLTWKGWF